MRVGSAQTNGKWRSMCEERVTLLPLAAPWSVSTV